MHLSPVTAIIVPVLLSVSAHAARAATPVQDMLDQSEADYRSRWRQVFVVACDEGGGGEDLRSYCSCVADRLLSELELAQLLSGTGMEQALAPAVEHCTALEEARTA